MDRYIERTVEVPVEHIVEVPVDRIVETRDEREIWSEFLRSIFDQVNYYELTSTTFPSISWSSNDRSFISIALNYSLSYFKLHCTD